MSDRSAALPPSSTDAPSGLSRRGLLRAAASAGALFALSSLPEFTSPADAAPRPDALSLVPEAEAVTLWYTQPGTASLIMNEGLPVGNGRLGAMTTGDPSHDTLIVTDGTLWTGTANTSLGADGQFPYDTAHFGSFGMLAKVYLDLPAHTAGAIIDYRRTLDLSNGLATVTYRLDGVTYRREIFASRPDDVLLVRLTQSGGGSHTGSMTLTGTRGETVTADASAAEVSFAAALPNTLRYATVVKAAGVGGTLSATGTQVTFTGCTEVLLVVSGGTNYKADASVAYKDTSLVPLTIARTRAAVAASTSGSSLLATHVADFQRLQGTMTLDLGTSTTTQKAMDTPSRLAARAAGSTPDPELEASYLQFARYLTICGSRDAMPTNLQGLWVDTNTPEWMADFHTDINVQMNYWLPDRAGLPECFDAFTDYCVAQLPGWEAATRNLFQDPRNGFRNSKSKAAGWTLAISTNIWGGNGWWWHPAGNAWVCNSLYEHYEYTQDTAHLARIHPLLKGACQFWEARLITTTVTDPVTGARRQVLVDDHDWSPEHGPTNARGITYAQELVWQLFQNYRAAAAKLGVDASYASTVADLQSRLYLPRVSATSGWLEEWMTDDNLGETAHRHLSAHVGLFPGDRINLQDSPAPLVAGATKLLEARGTASFGWASAWRAMCWARLKYPEKAYELVTDVMRPTVNHSNGSAINMFDFYALSAGGSAFQIDANFGTPVAMLEMLVQARPGRVELLPALPKAWAGSGSVTGVGVRGGFTLDLSWSSGQVTDATVHGAPGRSTTVVFGDWSQAVTVPAGGSVTVSPPAQYSVFQLVNRRTGTTATVPGGTTSAGTGLTLAAPGSGAGQQFRFVPVGDGLYEIHTTHGATPLAWDVNAASTADGARLIQWQPSHSANQRFRLTDTGGGYATLTCAHSGKVLAATADGAAIEQRTPGSDLGQQWRRVGV